MLSMLKEREITIVASTPYLDEVRCCERVAFLSEGKVRGIGTPETILDRFADIFNPPGIEHDKAGETKTDNVIEVSHLVKAFGSFHAVDDISFTVKRGEIFGFLGANGAGKTTAMHMLTGLNQPTSGTGTVRGSHGGGEYPFVWWYLWYEGWRDCPQDGQPLGKVAVYCP